MRLIDADWLLGELSNSWEKLRKKEIKHISITNLINNAPTAYDIDEVVERLEGEATLSDVDGIGKCYAIDLQTAVIIVTKGGTE